MPRDEPLHDHGDPRPATSPPPPEWRVRPFRPARWAPGPHAQTVAGKMLRPSPPVPLERERVTTPDGDFLDLDIGPEPGSAGSLTTESPAGAAGEPGMGGAPLVLVLHGLEGSSRRSYMMNAYRHLLDRGLRPVAMNFRGCGGEPNLLPRFYHSGETGDLAWVLELLSERFPGRAFGALGFSLGGNVLLKYLGEAGSEARLEAAVAVSVPFDLDAGCHTLERGVMARLYTGYFMRQLREKARRKRTLLEEHLDVAAVLDTRTLRAFDDAATAPLHGFRDATHYYAESSSAGFIPDIRVATLVVHALDDPFLPRESVPVEAMEANPWITPAVTARGGHVGFVEGPGPWGAAFWAEAEAARFLADRLGSAYSGRALEQAIPSRRPR